MALEKVFWKKDRFWLFEVGYLTEVIQSEGGYGWGHQQRLLHLSLDLSGPFRTHIKVILKRAALQDGGQS